METVVALGIIVSGLVGMMNLTIANQSGSEDASERLIATNLGREGIEVARSIRDTNWLSCEIAAGALSCNDWDEGLSFGTDTTAVPLFDVESNTWSIDFTPDAITHDSARVWRRSSGVAANIGTQFQSAVVIPADSTLTSYRRLLDISSICNDKTVAASCTGEKIGMRVQATVEWASRGRDYSITVEERLFNWR